MLFLFADESGDVNFKKGTRHFVYVGILTKSRKACDEKLIELKKNYEKMFHRKFQREIRASKMEKTELVYFLDGLKDLDYEIFCAHVDTYDPKKQFNSQDGNVKRMQLLEILITNVYSVNHGVNKIIIDKGLSQELRDNVQERLSQKYKSVPRIEVADSRRVGGIQIADLIAWAIRMQLGGDTLYYPYIENKIKAKTGL